MSLPEIDFLSFINIFWMEGGVSNLPGWTQGDPVGFGTRKAGTNSIDIGIM